MYKPSTWYLVVTYFPTYVPTYIWDLLFPMEFGYQGETEYFNSVINCGSSTSE
jgi:hypothetical protein